MVVFDTTTIILALDPAARPPTDPDGKVVPNCKERIEYLLATLHKARIPILIPTPVLAEYLVGAGPNRSEFINRFFSSKNFEMGPFDVRAAIDLSDLVDPDLQGTKKLDAITTKAKVKFDRQIVSIAKSRGADRIYTDDNNLAKLAQRNGIAATMTWEISLPPEAAQITLGLEDPPDGE